MLVYMTSLQLGIGMTFLRAPFDDRHLFSGFLFYPLILKLFS
ncbi:MAG: hypothetical protein R3311_00570 [Oceanisphaera sp.]|nr:hypothetical protein [Oceanisphaera sp.]